MIHTAAFPTLLPLVLTVALSAPSMIIAPKEMSNTDSLGEE